MNYTNYQIRSIPLLNVLNDTHRVSWCFTLFSTGIAGWLFTEAIKFYTFHYQYRCLKNVIHQIDSKNGWLLLSGRLTARFGLIFVLTLEKAFS